MRVDKLYTSKYFDETMPPVVVLGFNHEGRSNTHSHEFYELVYVVNGYALHSCDGNVSVLTAGDIFIVPPEQPHSYISANHAFIYNCLFLREAFTPMLTEVMHLPGLETIADGLSYRRVHADITVRTEFEVAFEQIKWEQLNRNPGWKLKINALFLGLLVSYSRIYEQKQLRDPEMTPSSMRILSAIAAIEENYKRDILVEEIAKVANMSVSQLGRQFKSLIGMYPMEYSRSFRIAKAAELIKSSQLPISEIAHEMGFNDISVFSRQFKHITGKSPSEYRKGSSEKI